MALQDLTPQLRTRLSRVERAVGWFVIVALALFLFGLGYYIYKRAENKGWFRTKVYYRTCVSTSEGLKEGDPVKLMGKEVGQIVSITPNRPEDFFNITVDFWIKEPHYGYLWSDSVAKVVAKDFLGGRYLEVTKGRGGVATVHETTNKVADGVLRRDFVAQREQALAATHTNHADVLHALNAEAQANPSAYYTNVISADTPYWLDPDEAPAVTERLERLVSTVESALPGILNLTNQIAVVLANSAKLTANLNDVATTARPAVSNLNLLTVRLNDRGALGDWLLPTNLNQRIDAVLGSADSAVANAATDLATLNDSLANLGNLTSNLNYQVQLNSNILGSISTTVVDTDDLVQGLKRHWLLRSAFKKPKTNKPPETVTPPKGNSRK